MRDKLYIRLQSLIPQHGASRFVARLMRSRFKPLKNTLIKWFMARYQIDLSTAELTNLEDYANFNSFFTRALKKEARPIDSAKQSVVSPADGYVSQFGKIKKGKIFQAKAHEFSLLELLGGDEERAKPFQNGEFITIYLSPRDYHRVHMPIAGHLTDMIYIRGKLFSVNNLAVANIPNLFSRNERVLSIFTTQMGPMAIILVGALLVASIETTWEGVVTPAKHKDIQKWSYENDKLFIEKGEEMGRFQFGSTVILLFGENLIEWKQLATGQQVQMGQAIGVITKNFNESE